MDPHLRERTLFGQALDLEGAERAAFLDRECAGDAALRERLERLLAVHAATAAFLPQLPRTLAGSPTGMSGEQPGEVIGRYKLLERVGEGGCGVVYVAEQTEPVRRRVALKVIKLGMDTKSVVARFEAERQALALMDHPNIARVLDAGATAQGRPFFVMELVRGIPITEYCDGNRLSTRDRLALFIKVCHAIQHAHQKGIIHRDIKPSNILVTVNDGVAVPKVIDFGIAKATEGRLTEATIYTHLHQFIGTPAYMSPEQAEMTSLDIDTRSDIYSLGVLLYELLSGTTPFEARTLLSAGVDAMRKIIREQEPSRPSTKLATLQGEDLSTAAKRRSTEAPKLVRQLKGDLDWITMKCLEKDRTRRYETANGLAADLQRHLGNEPVVARPPSTAYRMQKAFQRNKGAFAVAGLVVAVLMTATVFSGWQARKAGRAADVARSAQEEALARAQAERAAREEAEALVQFLSDVFRSPDPGRDGRTITVAETLAGAARRLETELAGQPERLALLQTALAETYMGLSFFPEAEALMRKVVEHHRATEDHDPTNSLKAMVFWAGTLHSSGAESEAMRLREELLERHTRLLGSEHPLTLKSMVALADSYRHFADRRDEAIRLLSVVLEAYRRQLGPDHLQTREVRVALGWHEFWRSGTRSAEVESLLREMLDEFRREKGDENVDTIRLLGDLTVYTQSGDALQLARETVELSRKVYGPEHQATIDWMINQARLQAAAGNIEAGIRTWEDAVVLRRKTLGEDHPTVLRDQLILADFYSYGSRFEESLRVYEESLPGLRKVQGEIASLSVMIRMAEVYARVGRWDDAIRMRGEARDVLHRHQPDNPHLATLRKAVIETCLRAGRLLEAGEALEAGIGNPGFDTIAAQDLATLQLWFGETEAYERWRGRLLDWAMGDTNFINGERMAKLSSLRPHASPAASEKALTLARRAVAQGAGHELRPWFLLSLGMVEHRAGRLADAEDTFLAAEQGASSYSANPRARIRATARLYRALGLHRQGRIEEALERFLEGEAAMKTPPAGTSNPFRDGENQNDVIAWLAYREAAALLQPPYDETLRARRAEIRQRLLEEDFGTHPPDAQAGLTLAALHLWTGDAAAYSVTRDRLLQWAAGNDALRYWEREAVAKAASLQPGAPASVRAAAVALARQAVELGAADAHQPWHQLALGMAELRNTNDSAADAALVAAARITERPDLPHEPLATTANLYQVIRYALQGRTAEANRLLDTMTARLTPRPPADRTLPLGRADRDQIVLWLAHEEARSLLDSSDGEAAP